MRVVRLWCILQGSTKLEALFGGVVFIRVPRAPFFEQFLEAGGSRDLLEIVLRWALHCRDSVVWLAVAIGPRVVVVVMITQVLVAVVEGPRWQPERGGVNGSR